MGSAPLGRWLLGLAVSAALLAPAAALAAETQTIHFSLTFVVARSNPCDGASATVTLTGKGVMHLTTLDNGTVHVMMMDVGTKSFTTSFHRNVVLRGRMAPCSRSMCWST